jgi:hypothetical protein
MQSNLDFLSQVDTTSSDIVDANWKAYIANHSGQWSSVTNGITYSNNVGIGTNPGSTEKLTLSGGNLKINSPYGLIVGSSSLYPEHLRLDTISSDQGYSTGRGTFWVNKSGLAYYTSISNKDYDLTGATKPIKVMGTTRNLYNEDHTFINTSSNPSGLENPIYLPATPLTGKIFVIVNRHTDDVRLRVGTSDVDYYTPSGTSNIVEGQSMVTIQYDGSNWYQIQ